MSETSPETQPEIPAPPSPGRRLALPVGIVIGTLVLLGFGAGLFFRAQSKVNKVSLDSMPKGVTVVAAKQASYRPNRRYVGTLEPWVEARVGPQFVSAYVDTVLVRPGAVVKRGDVLATLDCRNASATSKAIAMQAHALETMQTAIANESQRIAQLQDGGFVSPNEVEQKTAESASKQAQVLALQAEMQGSALQVNDCVLRAPFDGDVSERMADPGAFVKPGTAIVTVVDRAIIRLTADVPEDDFGDVSVGTPAKIHVLPTGNDLVRPITLRSPAADPVTRTVHLEIDIADPERAIPVHTTAEISIDVGQPVPATELPLAAVSIRGNKAKLFTLEGDKARAQTVPVKGEAGGSVFLDPSLKPGTLVVLEGRTLLNDKDTVVAKRAEEAEPAPKTADASETSIGTPQ